MSAEAVAGALATGSCMVDVNKFLLQMVWIESYGELSVWHLLYHKYTAQSVKP